MAYSVRYIMTWLSQEGEDCRIEILEKDYTGEASVKKMGSQPVMRIDSSEGGIIGTSLQMSIQADVDGELMHLYTTDSKKYKTILYKNDTPVWSGYLLQELYSENYIAPPYDVNLTATDQIALLKDVPYSAIGRMTLLEIIKKALQPTALELDFTIQASMKPTVLTEDVPFLSYITVNDYSFADSTCYEALQQILSTCNMALMQIDNRWHIYRINDISAKLYEYSNSLGLQQIVSAEPITIGQMHTDAVCPIGSLALRKIAAKKDAKFSFAPRQAQSILVDPAMTTGDGWFWNIDYINAKPGKFQLEFGPFAQIGASAVVNAFILESTLEQTKEFALWQNANVKKVDTTIKAQVSYLPLNSGLFTSSETTTNTVKLLIHFKLTTADGEVYYLNKDGWGNEDFQEIVFTGSMVYDSGAALRSNKDNYTTATIEVPGFPADGLLTVSFRNDSRIRPAVTGGPSDTDNPPFRVYPRIGITDVFITFPEIEGYDTTVKVAPDAAQGGEEYSITFADAYQIDNEELILYNFIEYPQVGKISKWQLLDLEFDTFYKAMIQDIANMTGLVKDGFSGVIGGKNLLSLSYLEKFSSSKLRLVSGEYNLYTDELSGEWEEIPAQMVQVGSYDTVVNNSGVVITGGSSSSSITPGGGSGTGSGNYVTNVALEAALAPILDWFELRTLESGTKILFTKYTLVSALDQIAGGVGEGGSSSSGAAYNRLDTWENYNEDAGDVLSAKLGYDLKQQIEQLQQSGGSGESVVANITVKIGDAEYTAVDGVVSLPAYPTIPTVPTKLSDLLDDLVAGNYLPLTGGILSGALSAPNINITSAAAVAHLAFGRQGGNIITAPSGGYFTFIPGGKSVATANADLVITDEIVYPGTTGVTKLGFGDKRWSQVSSVNGDFSGALTAGTFSTANVVSCGGRLRINASNSVTSFGFLKATAYATALNRAVLDIGSNYGGSSTITSEAVDVVAMSMYRGAVGVGRAFTYDELYANRASNIMLSVEGNINNVGDIVSTGEQVAGSDMRYKIVKSKFRLSSAIIAHAPLFRFKWKNHKTTKLKIGTSAQYWEEFAPELVTFDSVSDFKHLNYAGLGVAIGISNAREIEQLKKEIVSLKERLSKYEHN